MTPKWLGLAGSPNAQIIGWLDHPFGATATVPGPTPAKGLKEGSGEGREARLILTDPTVWTREARGALAAVPVIPVNAGSTVVAAEKKKAFSLDVKIPSRLLHKHTSIHAVSLFQPGIFSPVNTHYTTFLRELKQSDLFFCFIMEKKKKKGLVPLACG